MSTPVSITLNPGPDDSGAVRVPPLENGDHVDRQTFHERYKASPEGFRAQLIEGIVHLPPQRVSAQHGRLHAIMEGFLGGYQAATLGTECSGSTTCLLGKTSEPEPDAILLIEREYGGQTRVTADDYLEGAPELVCEIATSLNAIDFHAKRRDYERHGVKEYLVVAAREQQVYWWVSRHGWFDTLPPGPDGILRSETFPGLWLDPDALARMDAQRINEVLSQGLASPEHAAFVAKLEAARTRS